MDARRRLGPPALALAAAAVGARLLLGPERLVGELRPGSRGADAPPPAPALASPIAWEAAAAPGTGQAAARGAAVPEPAREPSWRDAPADFRAVSYSAAGSRRPASAARSAPPAARSAELEAAPSAAELSTHEDPARASAPPRRASRDSYRRRFSGFAPRAAAAARAVRVPFALGPAEPGGDVEPEEEARAPVDPRTSPSPGGWRRLRRAFPLFRAPLRPAAAARERARRVARVKPPSLSRLLGLAALRPPPAALPVPDLSGLDAKKPLFLPGGAPVPSRLLDALALEKLDPKRHGSSRDRKRSAHWDAARPLWHDGPARGLALLSQWQWLWKDDERWWAAREPGAPPLLRWGSLWWGKRRGVWFAQHGGEPWSWRRFSEWDAEGLIRLRDGVQLVYSADLSKVAVVEPGAGAVLYDAETGTELGRWTEDELPRRRPRPPSALRLPRGI